MADGWDIEVQCEKQEIETPEIKIASRIRAWADGEPCAVEDIRNMADKLERFGAALRMIADVHSKDTLSMEYVTDIAKEALKHWERE